MIQIIKSLLIQLINDIDSGNTNIDESQQRDILEYLRKINSKEMSKIESANYIGVSRATFDNYINNGWIPKGMKSLGFNEISWNKSDLDKFLEEYGKR